ncbi:MAG TPA: glycine zipper 2TM domain-containing protein [Noviherbaspirillum sp.]|nr:glycine zipper 2TM domain-containing protein [Noviherbaspirillum sp.]
MRNEKTKIAAIGMSVLMLAACGSSPDNMSNTGSSSVPVTASSSATGYGVVQAIDLVPREQAGIGLGTVAGAVVGGVLGSQVGSGSGRTAATVAGVAGGALAGHALENKGNTSGQVYRMAVRMDNGTVQTLVQEQSPGVQIGERVRLDNGVIIERFR